MLVARMQSRGKQGEAGPGHWWRAAVYIGCSGCVGCGHTITTTGGEYSVQGYRTEDGSALAPDDAVRDRIHGRSWGVPPTQVSQAVVVHIRSTDQEGAPVEIWFLLDAPLVKGSSHGLRRIDAGTVVVGQPPSFVSRRAEIDVDVDEMGHYLDIALEAGDPEVDRHDWRFIRWEGRLPIDGITMISVESALPAPVGPPRLPPPEELVVSGQERRLVPPPEYQRAKKMSAPLLISGAISFSVGYVTPFLAATPWDPVYAGPEVAIPVVGPYLADTSHSLNTFGLSLALSALQVGGIAFVTIGVATQRVVWKRTAVTVAPLFSPELNGLQVSGEF